jgi:hypothetical protein
MTPPAELKIITSSRRATLDKGGAKPRSHTVDATSGSLATLVHRNHLLLRLQRLLQRAFVDIPQIADKR